MAIDIFCYSSLSMEEIEGIVRPLIKKHPDIFLEKFLISRASKTSAGEEEFALDYDFHANSIFLIHVNDKNATNLVPEVAEIMKSTFSASRILMLIENELRL